MTRKRHSGRTPVLSAKLVSELETVLIGGSTIKDACQYVGIGESTYYKWMELSRSIADGEDNPRLPPSPRKRKKEGETVYQSRQREYEALMAQLETFAPRMDKARATMRVNAVAIVQDAALNGQWTAAAWLLERSDPENWGRRVIDQHTDNDIRIQVVRKATEVKPPESADDEESER